MVDPRVLTDVVQDLLGCLFADGAFEEAGVHPGVKTHRKKDLTTDLSRHPQMFVIARSSAFTYNGRAVRVEDVGQELRVRRAVEVHRQADPQAPPLRGADGRG